MSKPFEPCDFSRKIKVSSDLLLALVPMFLLLRCIFLSV